MSSQRDQSVLAEDVDLRTALEAMGTKPQSRRRRPIWLIVALAMATAASVLLVPWLARSIVFPSTDGGECMALYPQKCVSLSPSEVEATFALSLPHDAEIVDSGSDGFLLTETKYAVITVGPEQVSTLLSNYEPGDSLPTSEPPLDFGFESITQQLTQKNGDARATVGVGEDGETLIYLVWK